MQPGLVSQAICSQEATVGEAAIEYVKKAVRQWARSSRKIPLITPLKEADGAQQEAAARRGPATKKLAVEKAGCRSSGGVSWSVETGI